MPISKWQTFSDSSQTLLIDYGMDAKGDLLVLRLNFERGEYLEPIYIPREGPDGFNATDLFISYQGQDLIYVFPSATDKFYLYNSLGKLVEKYNYNDGDYTRFYISGFYSDIFYNQGEIMLPTINDTRFDDRDYFEKVIPFQKYDFTSRKFTDQVIYPEFVGGKFLPSNLSGGQISSYDSKTALINYPFSDSLYIYSFENKSIDAFYCGIENGHKTKFLDHVPDKEVSREYVVKEKNYEFAKTHNGKVYRLVSHLKNENSRELTPIDIIRRDLRGVTMIEYNPEDKSINYYEMPIARNFVFQENKLVVGGISIREDENQDTFRKFYVYQLN
ncbi:hypothetical protein [Algoriphagus antarcticus]|uniref:hypothetical protein n=1 Tax=Algoriphagus antarcticus TaxID=238540 RepID=UPI001123D798|nr:hypothetical protein [Algoriphagus antarcticus]